MSKLGDDLYRQLGGAVPEGIRGQMAELKQRFGTVTAAAKAAGVDRRTWQRIESGKTQHPKASTEGHIEQALGNARAQEATGVAQGATGVTVHWRFDGRTRELRFGEQVPQSTHRLKPGTAERMAAAYSDGNREGIARAFVDGIDDERYHEFFEEAYQMDAPAEGEGSDASGAFV